MEVLINAILMVLGIIDFIAMIILLTKVDCSIGQIILAIIFPPYRWYLYAAIGKKKKVYVAWLIISIIAVVVAIFFLLTIFDSYRTIVASSNALAGQNITEEVYNTMMEEKLVEFQNNLLSSFTLYYIIIGIFNIIVGVLEMIIYYGIGKSFSKSTGFCVGLALLSPIFLPILAFGDSSYNEWGY